MDTIFGIKDVISKEDCNLFINFINDNIDVFESYEEEGNPLRKVLRFGIDGVYETSHHDLSLIPGMHDTLRNLFSKVTKHIEEHVGTRLYVTSFHMGKQMAGSRVDSHIDADPEYNNHFKYSGVLYLNKVTSGNLVFPHKEISYNPNAADLIVFPSIGEEWEHCVNEISEDRYNLPIWFTEDPAWELRFFA